MSYEHKSSRCDHLTSTTKDGKIELTEQELNRVAGGAAHKIEFLKFDFGTVFTT
jgi:hypothetical protein